MMMMAVREGCFISAACSSGQKSPDPCLLRRGTCPASTYLRSGPRVCLTQGTHPCSFFPQLTSSSQIQTASEAIEPPCVHDNTWSLFHERTVADAESDGKSLIIFRCSIESSKENARRASDPTSTDR